MDRTTRRIFKRRLTAQTTTLSLLKNDFCGRSFAFTVEELVVCSGKNNGVVCADVVRNCTRNR